MNNIFIHDHVWLGWVVLMSWLIPLSVQSQQITGTYTISSPEASLFFLNPDYMNPARGGGAIAIGCNPAALTGISDRLVTLAFGLPRSSTGAFRVEAADSSDVYSAVSVDTELKLREMGGLAAIGYGQQHGRWFWGLSLMQPRRGGFSLSARGQVDLDAHFTLNTPITPMIDPDMPVDELPVKWDVRSRISLSLSGNPAELYLATLPIAAGFAYKRGPLSLGIGLNYQYIYTSQGIAQLNTHISGTATGVGTPHGVDLSTGLPWTGRIDATITVDDDPIKATYKIDASGSRFGLSFGTRLDWGPLSLGGSYGYTFRGNISGNYYLTSINTIDVPAEVAFSRVHINWSGHPAVNGTVDFGVADFKKDTLTYQESGRLSLGGVHTYTAGFRLLFLGAFVGGDIPEKEPDLTSIYFGIYIYTPIPKTPVRINIGVVNRTDGVRSKESYLTPFRVVSHIGMGVSVRLPLNRWMHINNQENWLRCGLRSSLASWMLNSFEEDGKKTTKQSLPSLTENLSLSLGLDFPF